MKNKEYIKRIENKLNIEMNLNDINVYVRDALDYLINPNEERNKDEIIMYLSAVTEIINEIKELLRKEEEINEQLY